MKIFTIVTNLVTIDSNQVKKRGKPRVEEVIVKITASLSLRQRSHVHVRCRILGNLVGGAICQADGGGLFKVFSATNTYY